MGRLWIRVPGSAPLLWDHYLFWRLKVVNLRRPSDLLRVWDLLDPEMQAALVADGVTRERVEHDLIAALGRPVRSRRRRHPVPTSAPQGGGAA